MYESIALLRGTKFTLPIIVKFATAPYPPRHLVVLHFIFCQSDGYMTYDLVVLICVSLINILVV